MKTKQFLRLCAAVLLTCEICISGGKAFADSFSAGSAEAGGNLIRVAYVEDIAPYQIIDKNNTLSGMHIELMNLLAEECEWDVEYTGFSTLRECTKALQNNKVDMILGAPLNETMDTSEFLYTTAISSTYICMVADNAVASLIKRNEYQLSQIVWEYRSLPYSNMQSYSHDASYVGVGTQKDVATVLFEDNIEVAFADWNSIQYYLSAADAADQYTILYNYVCPIQYGIAVQAEDADMVQTLDRAITRARVGPDFEQITVRWIPQEENELSAFLRQWGMIVLSVCLAIVAIFIVVTRLNRYLKTQVQERTEELQQANLRLRQESYLRNQAIRQNPNGILIFDNSGLIDISNESANQMLGIRSAKGHNISEFSILTKMLGSDEGQIQEQPVTKQTVRIQDGKNGGRTYRYSVEILREPHQDMTDRQMGFITFEDITLQDMQTKQMVVLEREKFLNQIVAGVAHEIRNPLSSIKSLAQIAPESKNDEEYLHAFEEIVPAEVDRINRLVDDLIDYTKKPARQGKKQPVDIGELIESSISLVQVLAKRQNIRVKSRVEGQITLMVDKDQLKQAILNILLNSLDAIKSKIGNDARNGAVAGWISIKVEQRESSVCIDILDTGIGMSQEAMLNATEPFYTTKSQGTGIGLAISERYIRENGGRLSFESEEGKYTIARIIFPKIPVREDEETWNEAY